jgi:hypothetical protein
MIRYDLAVLDVFVDDAHGGSFIDVLVDCFFVAVHHHHDWFVLPRTDVTVGEYGDIRNILFDDEFDHFVQNGPSSCVDTAGGHTDMDSDAWVMFAHRHLTVCGDADVFQIV